MLKKVHKSVSCWALAIIFKMVGVRQTTDALDKNDDLAGSGIVDRVRCVMRCGEVIYLTVMQARLNQPVSSGDNLNVCSEGYFEKIRGRDLSFGQSRSHRWSQSIHNKIYTDDAVSLCNREGIKQFAYFVI